MEVTRREFLRMAGASAVGTVLFAGCAIPTKELLVQSPHDVPEDFASGFDNWYASIYPTSAGLEGIIVRVVEGRAKKIEGNPDFPVNQGKSSARSQAAVQALYHPDRIKTPLRRQGNEFAPITWDQARTELAAQLRNKQASAGDVLLITQPLRGTLGKMVNLFAREYGARHAAYETLDTTVLRGAVKNVFGTDQLPTFDIAHADFLLSFGADFLGTWTSPVQFGRGYGEFRQGADRERGYFIQVEPRMSQTAAVADEWIYVNPGTEGILALAVAQLVVSGGKAKNAGALGTLPSAGSLEDAARMTGVSVEKIRHIADLLGNASHPIVIGGGSAGAHTNGLFNLQAIYSLNVLADNVGKEGGVVLNPPFPLEDIPSATSGASYQEWKTLAGQIGPNNLVIVRGANPVYGLSNAVNFGAALDRAGYVVAFASFMDETAALADLVLPESVSLESWGDEVPDPGPGYATLGIMQPVVKPVFTPQGEGDLRGETRQFGDELLAVSRELGLTTLPWNSVMKAVQATARALYEGGRPGLVRAGDFESYWRGLLMRGGWWDPAVTADAAGVPAALPAAAEPQLDGGNLPYNLLPFPHITLLDGEFANLLWMQATPDPLTTMAWKTWVEVNTRTAESLDLRLGDEVELTNGRGQTIAIPVFPSPAAAPNVLSVPMGQGHVFYGQWAEERGQNILSALADVADTTTGGLAWAATKVGIRKTGRRMLMSKFEGVVPAYDPEDVKIVEVTRGKGAGGAGH